MNTIIRILIADDHAVVREGLRALIATEPGMAVVGEAANGSEAVQLANNLQPDVILLDLMMPLMDGLAAIRAIKQANQKAHILILTSFAEDDNVFPSIKAGALGYLLKESSPQELLQAIRQVSKGEASLHPTVARKLMLELSQPSTLPLSTAPLTGREIEVLRQVARGHSNQDIAQALLVSERTIRTHVSNILNKLHVANRTQAALYALREGLAGLKQEER